MDDEQKPPLLLLQAPDHHQVASSEYNPSLSFNGWTKRGTTSQATPHHQSLTAGLLMIKEEPWQGPPGLSPNDCLPSAARFWTGPTNRIQTHSPPTQVNNLLPFSSGNPNLLKLLPKTGIPTRPRSFLKRKASDNEQPGNGSKMRKSADNLICHLCNSSCSSAFTMQQHLKGRHHKAKMRYMKMKRDSFTTARRGGNLRCEICEIWCNDVDALKLHFKGKKHKARMQEKQQCKGRGGQKPSKAPIICEVCGVPCMNQDCFEQHLKGRQHAAKLELKRRGFL